MIVLEPESSRFVFSYSRKWTSDFFNGFRRDRLEKSRRLKEMLGCSICGIFCNHEKLEYHHVNPKMKTDTISNLLNKGFGRFLHELSFCTIVCDKCHAKINKGKKIRKYRFGLSRRPRKRLQITSSVPMVII